MILSFKGAIDWKCLTTNWFEIKYLSTKERESKTIIVSIFGFYIKLVAYDKLHKLLYASQF